MKDKLVNILITFMAVLGAWSFGGDVVDCWRGLCPPWFWFRLSASAAIAAITAFLMRKEKGGE